MQGPVFVPIDLAQIVAIVMGISIVLVPVIGLTARFALKPTVEAMGRLFEKRGQDETIQILERRMSLLEQQIESVESSLRRLAEVSEFHAELRSGAPPEQGPGSSGSDEA